MVHNIFKGLGIALITPFKEDGSVDYDALIRLVDYQLNNGADFFCILATTGETPTLTREEKQKIKDTGKKLFKGALSLFAAPIITACLANCLITKSVKRINAEEKLNAQVKTLENIYIGCSKEWIDEKLGAPTFMYSCEGKTELTNMTPKEIDYDFLACVYVTDIAVLKTYFGKEDNSCQAFFITATDEKLWRNI